MVAAVGIVTVLLAGSWPLPRAAALDPVGSVATRSGPLAGSVPPIARSGWTNVSNNVTGGPQSVAYAATVVDSQDDYAIVFGGITAGGVTNESWIFDDGAWEETTDFVLGATPPPLYSAQIAYDVADGYVVLFGGRTALGALYAGTWTYRSYTWTHLSGGPSPPAAAGGSMAYDPSDGYLVLQDPSTADTWTFHAGIWTPHTLSPEPPARTGAIMATLGSGGPVLLSGGDGLGASSGPLADTWTFAHGAWTQVLSTSPTPLLVNMSATYDPVTGGVFVFGSPVAASAETWNLSQGAWTRYDGESTVEPPPRRGASLVWDTSGAVILCGGTALDGRYTLSDCWAWGLPLPSTDSSAHASPIPSGVLELAVAGAVVPLAVAVYWALRPKRPDVTRASAPAGHTTPGG